MQSIDEARVKIEELKAEIEKNNKLYYEDDNPIISDYDYDMMMRQLISLEEKYPELKTPDSPSNRVGGKALSKFEPIRHRSTWSSPTTAPPPTRSRPCVGREPRCSWSNLQET